MGTTWLFVRITRNGSTHSVAVRLLRAVDPLAGIERLGLPWTDRTSIQREAPHAWKRCMCHMVSVTYGAHVLPAVAQRSTPSDLPAPETRMHFVQRSSKAIR